LSGGRHGRDGGGGGDWKHGEMQMRRTFSVKVDARGSAVHLHEGSWSPDGRYLRFRIGGDHGICD